MNWFKPIAGIILIAWIIGRVFCEIIPRLSNKMISRNTMIYYFSVVFLVVVFQFAANECGLHLLSGALGVSRNDIHSLMWRRIYIGFNVEDNGKLGSTSRALQQELHAQYSAAELDEVWKEKTIESLKQNYKKLPALFLTKFKEQWKVENALLANGWRRPPNLDEESKNTTIMSLTIIEGPYTTFIRFCLQS